MSRLRAIRASFRPIEPYPTMIIVLPAASSPAYSSHWLAGHTRPR